MIAVYRVHTRRAPGDTPKQKAPPKRGIVDHLNRSQKLKLVFL